MSLPENNPATLPDNNSEYSQKEYWDGRYEKEDSYEWFKGYESFRRVVAKYVEKTDTVLMLGCGNSPLSADMYADGYHHITNVDYSRTCIRKMAARHQADMPGMAWMEMDVRELGFADGSFHVALEKGTLDALMVAEKSPWTVSNETRQCIDRVLTEVSRVLCKGGHFISITSAQPHFRTPLYAQAKYGWSVTVDVIGDAFQFFCYTMTKGGELTAEQIGRAERFFNPPVNTSDDSQSAKSEDDGSSDGDAELFFSRLNPIFT